MPRHTFPCSDPDCGFCETQAELLADRNNEARADQIADQMADAYERWVDQW